MPAQGESWLLWALSEMPDDKGAVNLADYRARYQVHNADT